MLCYALLQASHPTIGQLKERLQSDWMKAIEDKECSGLQRVAAFSGVIALNGAEHATLGVGGRSFFTDNFSQS